MSAISHVSTGRAKKGETCCDCGKEFREGERIHQYWIGGDKFSQYCWNSVACERRMGRCPACGKTGPLNDGCPTCPGFWFAE